MKYEHIEATEVLERYGVNPLDIGLRHRGYWIVKKIDEEEENGNASIGDLCVKARDGCDNDEDEDAEDYPNYVGTSEDGFDQTYRYYYFSSI